MAKKKTEQHTVEGGVVPKARIFIKPAGIPYEIRTEKFKLNTTEEGFENRKDAEPSELQQWVLQKMKPLKEVVLDPKVDYDDHSTIIADVITRKIEVPIVHVGEDED